MRIQSMKNEVSQYNFSQNSDQLKSMSKINADHSGIHVPIWEIESPWKVYKNMKKFKIEPVSYDSNSD